MLAVRTLLFPTDFSPLADAALDHALAFAQKHGAALHMLHAVVLHADDRNEPARHFPDAEAIRVRLEGSADGRMASQVLRRAPCPVLTVRPFGKSLLE